MSTLASVLFHATAVAYLVASVGFVLGLFGRIAQRDLGWADRLLGVGALMHAAHIVLWSLVLRVCPVEGVYFPISLGANLMVGVYFAVRGRLRLGGLGAVVGPIALTTLLASRFTVAATAPPDGLRSALLPFHITANLVGIALFTLASGSALLYLVQERRLTSKKLSAMGRLPPLDALDRAEHRLLLAGFPLLTLGVVTGSFFLARGDGLEGSGLRTAFGYLTWLLFAGVLLLRSGAGWRGRRAAYGTLVGFGFAVLVLGFYMVREALMQRMVIS